MVDLAPFGMPGGFEELWCHEVTSGQFVVACLPFFTYGIALGDLISAGPPDFAFESVLQSSGLRTLRGCFSDPDTAHSRHEELHAALSQVGHPYEWHGSGYFAVLLPNHDAVDETLRALASLVKDGGLTWEIDPEARE